MQQLDLAGRHVTMETEDDSNPVERNSEAQEVGNFSVNVVPHLLNARLDCVQLFLFTGRNVVGARLCFHWRL